jgi:hypothetical protein
MQTIWLSPTDFVTGDPTLKMSYPFVSHPSTVVTCTIPGDLKWVSMGLPLPSEITIEEVTICYELSNSQSFISQVRLVEMTTPNQALVRHDDPTDLKSTSSTCYSSKVADLAPTKAVTLELRLNFQNTKDQIRLGAVGVTFQPKTEHCVNSMAGLKALQAGVLPCVTVLGYYAPGDGGGGDFYWDATSTAPDNGGTIIVPNSKPHKGRWRRVVDGPLSIRWFGAKGTGDNNTADINRIAIMTAIDAAPIGGTVFMPTGTYFLAGSGEHILALTKPVSLVGEGLGTVLKIATSVGPNTDVIHIVPRANMGIEFARLEHFVISPELVKKRKKPPGRYGIHIDTNAPGSYVSKLKVDHVYIQQLRSAAVKSTNPSNKPDGFFTSSFSNCQFYGGMVLSYSGDSNQIERCGFSGPGFAIDLQMVYIPPDDNVTYPIFASETTIADCNMTSSGGAIRVRSGSHVKVFRNNIEVSAASGNPVVWLDGSTQQLILPEVRQNYISGFGAWTGNAVVVDHADDALISDNTIVLDTATHGIQITANANRTRVGYNYYPLSPGAPGFPVTDQGNGTAGVTHIATLLNSFTNVGLGYGPAAYSKDLAGFVHIEGVVMRTTPPDPTTTIFMLPVGFRPASGDGRVFGANTTQTGATLVLGEVRVESSGEVKYQKGETTTYLCLDGIVFRVELPDNHYPEGIDPGQ